MKVGHPGPPQITPDSIFNEARLKVWRAKRHIHEISATWESWVQQHPDVGRLTFDPTNCTKKLNTDIKCPIDISLAVGDCIRCLRSAMDYLVCALARSANPAISDENLIFPFADKREVVEGFFEADRLSKKGRTIRAKALYPLYCEYPDLKKIILDKIQPYSADDGASAMGDLLWRVITMDNIDKHRLITPTVQVAGLDTVKFTDGGGVYDLAVVGDVLRFGPEKELEGEPDISVDIIFQPDTRLPMKPIVSALVSGANAVVDSIEIFETHFQGKNDTPPNPVG